MSPLVYVGAVGRSGTTLLERAAATSPSCVALGEVVHLWERGVRDNESCSCGKPFVDCEVWADVGERAFGGWASVDLGAVLAAKAACDRNRYIPSLIAPRFAPRSFRAALNTFTAALAPLYAALGAYYGDDVTLIDASKHPSYLFVLRHVDGLSPRLLHVVRDPRGVAHSWNKVVIRPESGGEMERLGSVRAALRWTSHNLLFHLAGWMNVPRRALRYERFTERPEALRDALGGLADHALAPMRIDGRDVVLGDDHTVSGNPMRFDRGTVTIRSDDGWRTLMPATSRRLVSALTWPLRLLYRP